MGQGLDPWRWDRYNIPKHQLQFTILCVTSKKNEGLIYAAAESWNHSSLKRMKLFFLKGCVLVSVAMLSYICKLHEEILVGVALFQGMEYQAGFITTAVLEHFDWEWLEVSCKCDILCFALGWFRQLRCVRNLTPRGSLSSEASMSIATQEITRVLCEPNVHYLYIGARHFSLSWPIYIQSTTPTPTPNIFKKFLTNFSFCLRPLHVPRIVSFLI